MVYNDCKKLNKKRTCFEQFALAVFLGVLLSSCATTAPTPEKFYEGRSGFALLPEGAALYITADVKSSRPILDALVMGGFSGTDIKDFLDMSDAVSAAVFPSVGEWRDRKSVV